MTVNLNASGTAQTRGWGSGWPTNNSSKMGPVTWSNGVGPVPSVRRELVALITLLGNETIRRGYHPRSPGCWGYANRSIAGTNTPSNHSWGLAVDINAPTNPQHDPLHTDMPSWMPNLWNAYGFRWGGDYHHSTPDPMHYEFMGTPTDAQILTAKARADFSQAPPTPTPPPLSQTGVTMPMLIQSPDGHSAYLLDGGKLVDVTGPTANSMVTPLKGEPLTYAKADAAGMANLVKAYGVPVKV